MHQVNGKGTHKSKPVNAFFGLFTRHALDLVEFQDLETSNPIHLLSCPVPPFLQNNTEAKLKPGGL